MRIDHTESINFIGQVLDTAEIKTFLNLETSFDVFLDDNYVNLGPDGEYDAQLVAVYEVQDDPVRLNTAVIPLQRMFQTRYHSAGTTIAQYRVPGIAALTDVIVQIEFPDSGPSAWSSIMKITPVNSSDTAEVDFSSVEADFNTLGADDDFATMLGATAGNFSAATAWYHYLKETIIIQFQYGPDGPRFLYYRPNGRVYADGYYRHIYHCPYLEFLYLGSISTTPALHTLTLKRSTEGNDQSGLALTNFIA